MRQRYQPPRITLFTCLMTDVITVSADDWIWENDNMGEWDDVD